LSLYQGMVLPYNIEARLGFFTHLGLCYKYYKVKIFIGQMYSRKEKMNGRYWMD
jgi:hypothetical protein